VGGITQSIGAYEVEIEGRKITFIDTPGHEAFTAMRARGAQVTHLVVLVVAADDGVMPQTVEAINHARAAGVPIIVAINKIDKPEANIERTMRQLAEQGLIPEEWGGETVCVPISALKKQNLDTLLEMILLVADLLDIKADPTGPAEGTVIESKKDPTRGPVATVIVQKGTLKVGDWVVVGDTYGRVRALLDWQGKPVREAGPSKPVEVVGLEEVPRAGDKLRAVGSRREALELAERAKEERGARAPAGVSLESLAAGEERELRLVVKASTQGAVEAARKALEQLDSEEIGIRVIHAGVGDVNESDVMLASASRGMVVGFGVGVDPAARRAAEGEGVSIRTYDVIYDLIDDIEAAMLGMLEPEVVEETLGKAEVRALEEGASAGKIPTFTAKRSGHAKAVLNRPPSLLSPKRVTAPFLPCQRFERQPLSPLRRASSASTEEGTPRSSATLSMARANCLSATSSEGAISLALGSASKSMGTATSSRNFALT